MTVEVLERALTNAKSRKGLIRDEAKRMADTTPVQGESRNTKKVSVPDSVKKLVPKMTDEQFAQYKADMEAESKALRS
jgi:hypothetical protein